MSNTLYCARTVQKRVVNVYRLITRGTLEEKIMGLQKFKMSIANTIISQDNASLQSMGTDQLLNLFSLDKVRPPGASGAVTCSWRSKHLKEFRCLTVCY